MTAQVEPYDPGDSADASPAPGSVEDVGKRPKKPKNALERIREQSERREGEELTQGAQNDADEPGSKTTAPGDAHTYQEDPMGDTSDTVDRTDVPCRDTRSGGCRGKEEASGGVEVDWDRRKVVKDAGRLSRTPEGCQGRRKVVKDAGRLSRTPEGCQGRRIPWKTSQDRGEPALRRNERTMPS